MRYRLAIGVAAFVVSLFLSSIWNAPRTISLCDVEADPAHYFGKTIRFRAIIERQQEFEPTEGDFISACSKCDTVTFASARLKIDPDSIKDFPLPRSLVTRNGEGNQIYLMDAVIIGRLDSQVGSGCWSPKYSIISDGKVEQVFSIQKFEDAPQAMKWLESNSY